MDILTSRPSVFVLNPHYTGIGIARSLAGIGARIVGLTFDPRAPALASKFFDVVHQIPDGRTDAKGLLDRLVELAASESERPILFPTRDFDIAYIQEYRTVLEKHFVLSISPTSQIARLMDKMTLAEVARTVNVDVPETRVISSSTQCAEVSTGLSFPLILKPRVADQWRDKETWARVGAQKAIIVASLEELTDVMRRIEGGGREMLLQEYVPGDDAEIVTCCVYVDKAGAIAGYFCARKLMQSPRLVGTGCVVEAIDLPALLEPSRTILREFGYSGIAELEFKRSPGSQTYKLIEINPRHWDQHELGLLVGINISKLAYMDLTGNAVAPVRPTFTNGRPAKWIAEREFSIELSRRILAAFRPAGDAADHGKQVSPLSEAWTHLGLLRGQRKYSVASWRDFAVSVRWLVGIALELLRGVANALSTKPRA